VLMVVGAASPKQSVSAGCTRLVRAGARLLGIVLNRVDFQRNSHYYQYSYYSNSYYATNGSAQHQANDNGSAASGSLQI
jgi:Mrp family chromosome partitioning ATPase